MLATKNINTIPTVINIYRGNILLYIFMYFIFIHT